MVRPPKAFSVPSDLSRAPASEPDHSWPQAVEIRLWWPKPNGTVTHTKTQITADQFFGRGGYGAPITGDWIVNQIERMRRAGPMRKDKRK